MRGKGGGRREDEGKGRRAKGPPEEEDEEKGRRERMR